MTRKTFFPEDPAFLAKLAAVKLANGEWTKAASLLKRILVWHPDHAESLTNCALVQQRAGTIPQALQSIQRALAAKPQQRMAWQLLAVLAHQSGNQKLVREGLLQQLVLAPDNPEILSELGEQCRRHGQTDQGKLFLRRSLIYHPAFFAGLYNLGIMALFLGEPGEGVCHLLRSNRSEPAAYPVAMATATGLKRLGSFDRAEAAYRAALCLSPADAVAMNDRGNCLRSGGEMAAADLQLRRALTLDPQSAETTANLANVLLDGFHGAAAALLYRKALVQRPDYAEAYSNLSIALKESSRLETAVIEARRASRVEPAHAGWRMSEALSLFCLGRMAEAWEAYETRALPQRPLTMPLWDGCRHLGKSLLITAEQGIGDQIQGASAVPDAARLVGNCVLECQARLTTLFQRSFPHITVVPMTAPPAAAALACDLQIPMFGMMKYLRKSESDFPRQQGYLHPDPARTAFWRRWLDSLGTGPKVGLSWRGRLVFAKRARNFLPLPQLQPILDVAGVSFVNLQYDGYLDELAEHRKSTGQVIHVPPGIDLTEDLDDVAALMAALDAVVGPSNTVTDLAGAVGRPTWMYACFPGGNHEKDIMGFNYTPWWPSVRLETWSYQDDPQPVIDRVATGLRTFVISLGAPQ